MKKKVSRDKRKVKQGKKQPPEKEAENTDSFDFGGIPERNLKKNLGCG